MSLVDTPTVKAFFGMGDTIDLFLTSDAQGTPYPLTGFTNLYFAAGPPTWAQGDVPLVQKDLLSNPTEVRVVDAAQGHAQIDLVPSDFSAGKFEEPGEYVFNVVGINASGKPIMVAAPRPLLVISTVGSPP